MFSTPEVLPNPPSPEHTEHVEHRYVAGLGSSKTNMKLKREENYFRNRGSTNYNNLCPHIMDC